VRTDIKERLDHKDSVEKMDIWAHKETKVPKVTKVNLEAKDLWDTEEN